MISRDDPLSWYTSHCLCNWALTPDRFFSKVSWSHWLPSSSWDSNVSSSQALRRRAMQWDVAAPVGDATRSGPGEMCGEEEQQAVWGLVERT